MRNGKVLLLLTVLLLGLLFAAVLSGQRDIPGDSFIGAEISMGDQTEKLAGWYDVYYGVVYFFLPGGTTLDQVRLQVYEDGVYAIGGQPIENGMSCEMFETGVTYDFTSTEDDWTERLVFLHSENVASMFLDTHSGNMDHIHEDKNHSETGTARLYSADGTLCGSINLNKISGRGQSSWNEEKKSYNITLSREEDLLGLGAAENWVLQSNAKDASNLRNKLIYDFADRAGLAFSPDTQWIDLYLNGEYAGLYLLCEKNEIHPNRVDISREGSFLVTKDGQWRLEAQSDPYIQTRENTALEIRYSDMDQTRLLALWQSVENAIMEPDGMDPVTGKYWSELIDMDSWVKKHLLEEVFGSQDALMLSQYFYMDGSSADSRIFAGPVWDYDLTMQGEPNWLYAIRPDNYGTLWPPALYAKPDYYASLTSQYETLFRPMLLELLDSGIDGYYEQIAQAARRNAARWYLEDAQTECEKMCSYLQQRIAFLDSLWLGETEFVMILAEEDNGAERYYALEAGSTLEMLPQFEDTQYIRYCGWFDTATDAPVDLSAPVYEDMSVYMKVERIPQNAVPVTEEAEAEPLRKTQLLGAAVFLVMLAVLAAAEGFRQRGNRYGR